MFNLKPNQFSTDASQAENADIQYVTGKLRRFQLEMNELVEELEAEMIEALDLDEEGMIDRMFDGMRGRGHM